MALPAQADQINRGDLNKELHSLIDPKSSGAATIHTGKVRLTLYRNALAMFGDKPFLGYGIGSFAANYPRYHDAVTQTHTYETAVAPEYLHHDFFQALVETGLIGGALLLFLAGLLLLPIFRRSGSLESKILGAAMAAIFLHSMLSFPLHMPVPAMFFCLYAGMLPPSKPGAQPLETMVMVVLILIGVFVSAMYVKQIQAERSRSTAQQFLASDKIQEAFAMAGQATRQFPMDWRGYDLQLTIAAQHNLGVREGLNVAETLLSQRPYHANSYFRKAYILYRAGRNELASEAVANTLKFGGEQGEVLYLSGLIQRSLGNEHEAEKQLQRAIHLKPELERLNQQE